MSTLKKVVSSYLLFMALAAPSLARHQPRLGPERDEALVALAREAVLHDRDIARFHRRAVGPHDHQEARVRAAREAVHVVAVGDADGAGGKAGARAGGPSARRDRGAQAQVRLRDPRVAPAHEALRRARDVRLVERGDVGPARGARVEHEVDTDVAGSHG